MEPGLGEAGKRSVEDLPSPRVASLIFGMTS